MFVGSPGDSCARSVQVFELWLRLAGTVVPAAQAVKQEMRGTMSLRAHRRTGISPARSRSPRPAIRFRPAVLIFPTGQTEPFDSAFPHGYPGPVLALAAFMAVLRAARRMDAAAAFRGSGIVQVGDFTLNGFRFFRIRHVLSLALAAGTSWPKSRHSL